MALSTRRSLKSVVDEKAKQIKKKYEKVLWWEEGTEQI
jgi:hypothetical protein